MPLEEASLVLNHKAVTHPPAPSETTEQKFVRLRDEWKVQRRHESSTLKVVMLPAYQKIIGMGSAAVPFLLRELETNLDSWFWALTAITEADPAPKEARGDGEAMAQAWLKWAQGDAVSECLLYAL